MIRPLLAAALAGLASPALAHGGHLGALAGHDHWVAGAAIGLGIAIAAWGLWSGRPKGRRAPEDEATDEEARP